MLYKLFSHLCRRLHQQFESYKEQVRKIGEEARRYQGEHKDDAPTCGICHKTKFADGCGHLCSYCRTKFCARCGGRVSLRSNNVSLLTCTLKKKPPWCCHDADYSPWVWYFMLHFTEVFHPLLHYDVCIIHVNQCKIIQVEQMYLMIAKGLGNLRVN